MVRIRPLKKSWYVNNRLIIVDEKRSLQALEELCEHDQNKDAYWEAIDFLANEEPLYLSDEKYWEKYDTLRSKLLKIVKNEVGYINRGEFLVNGTNGKNGRVWWEKLDKSESIRWAMATFIQI